MCTDVYFIPVCMEVYAQISTWACGSPFQKNFSAFLAWCSVPRGKNHRYPRLSGTEYLSSKLMNELKRLYVDRAWSISSEAEADLYRADT
jgi:hypothetical protein